MGRAAPNKLTQLGKPARPPRLNTEARVRLAAQTLFMKKGYAATGIRDIAKAAGISTASLYHYMPSKEQLLIDVTLEAMAPLVEPAREVAKSGVSSRELLALLIRNHVIVHTGGKALWEVADEEWRRLEPPVRRPIVQLRDEYQRLWERAIADGMAEGAFRTGDVKMATFAILAMCSGVYKWYSPRGRYRAEQIAEDYVRYAVALLEPDTVIAVKAGRGGDGHRAVKHSVRARTA